MNIPPIGTLSDRVLLQRREDIGADQTVFVPISTSWARVRSTSEQGHTHTVVIRFRSDIRSGDRVVYRGRPLEVKTCEDVNGRRAYLLLRAVEVAA